MKKIKDKEAMIIIILFLLLVSALLIVCLNVLITKDNGNVENGKTKENINTNYINLLNVEEINSLKTKISLHTSIEDYNRYLNNTNGGEVTPFVYNYTIKKESFKIDKVQVDCEIILEEGKQFIKLPSWFVNYFDIKQRIQLDRLYSINMNSCLLELIDIDVEKQEGFDIRHIKKYKIYESEKTKKDYKTMCLYKYIDKTIIDSIRVN